MYRIIGADGREYGPISADQLRVWIRQGRANAHTKIRIEGASEWKTLSEFPEFGDALSGQAAPPSAGATTPPRPLLGASESESIAREIIARDYQLGIGRCISRGWDLVMANFWLTVGATLLVYFLSAILGSTGLGGLLLNFVVAGGLDWMYLKMIRGQPAELGDIFAGFSLAFLPLMLFSIVGQLLTTLGVFLCVLPGIYLGVAWFQFTSLLILDKRLDFWPAMELSRKVVTHHWWQVFGFVLLCLVLRIAGTMVFCLGFFIALPITVAAKVYAYEEIFGSRPALAAPEPAPPGPVPTPPTPPTPVPPMPPA